MSPQVEKEYRELARDYQNSQAKYQELRAKQMEAQVAQNLEADRKGERFTLIEPPMPPEEPVSPNRLLIWLIGIVMSVGLAVGCVALLEVPRCDGSQPQGSVRVAGRRAHCARAGDRHFGRGGPGRTRVRYALGAVAVAAVSAILAVHLLYRPVDVLWFQVLRKFGM